AGCCAARAPDRRPPAMWRSFRDRSCAVHRLQAGQKLRLVELIPPADFLRSGAQQDLVQIDAVPPRRHRDLPGDVPGRQCSKGATDRSRGAGLRPGWQSPPNLSEREPGPGRDLAPDDRAGDVYSLNGIVEIGTTRREISCKPVK